MKYCNGNEWRGGSVIFAVFKYDDMERILFMLGPVPTHHTPIMSHVPVSIPTAAPTDFNDSKTRNRLDSFFGWWAICAGRPPIDGLSGGWMNHPPSIIMPLGLCQTNGVGLDVRMKCCVKNFQTGFHFRRCGTVPFVQYPNQIKSRRANQPNKFDLRRVD